MAEILVLYYSRNGATAELARQVCRGVESRDRRQCEAAYRAACRRENEAAAKPVPRQRRRPTRRSRTCVTDGLVLGSPTRFGNMAAP